MIKRYWWFWSIRVWIFIIFQSNFYFATPFYAQWLFLEGPLYLRDWVYTVLCACVFLKVTVQIIDIEKNNFDIIELKNYILTQLVKSANNVSWNGNCVLFTWIQQKYLSSTVYLFSSVYWWASTSFS